LALINSGYPFNLLIYFMHIFRKLLVVGFFGLVHALAPSAAYAGLFDDEEARKAILDLRQKVDANKLAADAAKQAVEANLAKQAEEVKALTETNATLRKSLLDLQNQIEALRTEQAKMRGQDEQLARDVAEMQRRQKDLAQGVDERMRKFEPLKVTLDGREFNADAKEKADFDAAFALFRKPDPIASQNAFSEFLRRYPQSGYVPSALFWLGNSQYSNRDYIGAMNNFRAMIAQAPDHPKSSEAALSIANCQIELKDTRATRKTLEDLIKVYPQSEAAVAARDRLAKLK
jgi:tol-pal system protein YbgF